jgi:hypothetical protein
LQSAKDSLGSDLVSIVLYGSAAESKLHATSDVNLLIVLSSFQAAKVDPLRQPLRVAQSAIQLHPMFLLQDEIIPATHAFAPKFADILRRRVILHGSDPFASVSIPRENEVRQLRQQLLNLILRLRASYVARSLRTEQLILVIAGAAGPLRVSAANLLDLEGHPAASAQQAFEQLGAELTPTNWPQTLALLNAAQDSRLSPPSEAPRLFFALLDLACLMGTRAQALSGEVRRESL